MKHNETTPTRPGVFLLIAGFALIYHSSFCQSGVGIGIVNPDPRAVPHVQQPIPWFVSARITYQTSVWNFNVGLWRHKPR
jgi:hypothetical protein